MKKVFYPVALMAVLATLNAGCQKETMIESPNIVVEVDTVYTVCYSVNGITHTELLNNEAEYNALLLQLFALTREGYEVEIVGENAIGSAMLEKERLIYTTDKESEAVAWTKQKINEG